MSTSLYETCRPKSLREVVGQDNAVRILTQKLREESLPHTVMFAGPTGSGKSTLAHIVANELGCGDNLTPINCADDRGMDMVREIQTTMRYQPMNAKCRVWILEEVIQIPKLTQKAFLDVLEHPPETVYFLLCTNDTGGLLDTFLGRCFILNLAPLAGEHLATVLSRATATLNTNFPEPAVVRAIVTNSQGSARVALQLLEAALAVKGEKAQLEAVQQGVPDKEALVEFLGRALIRRASWADLAKALKPLTDQEAEGVRRQVLAYMTTVLLGGGDKSTLAYHVIEAFREPFYQNGKALLVAAVWRATQMAR